MPDSAKKLLGHGIPLPMKKASCDREDQLEFLQKGSQKDPIKKHSEFIGFPREQNIEKHKEKDNGDSEHEYEREEGRRDQEAGDDEKKDEGKKDE